MCCCPHKKDALLWIMLLLTVRTTSIRKIFVEFRYIPRYLLHSMCFWKSVFSAQFGMYFLYHMIIIKIYKQTGDDWLSKFITKYLCMYVLRWFQSFQFLWQYLFSTWGFFFWYLLLNTRCVKLKMKFIVCSLIFKSKLCIIK